MVSFVIFILAKVYSVESKSWAHFERKIALSGAIKHTKTPVKEKRKCNFCVFI